MDKFEGYCILCREKQMIKDAIVTQTSRGRAIVKGTCPVCNTRITRFLTGLDLRRYNANE